MPTHSEVPIGTPVFLWARPLSDLILLMGDGTYDGMNHINGTACPVVKLLDGREITVHFTGVYVGTKVDVSKTCGEFKAKGGDVLEWGIDQFLKGKLPTREQRVASGVTGVAESVALVAAPKTYTDKLVLLRREIEVEKLKIEAANTVIASATKAIEEKRAQMAAMKDEVLREFSELENIPEATILAAAERIKAKTVVAASAALLHAVPAPPLPSDDEHFKLATED